MLGLCNEDRHENVSLDIRLCREGRDEFKKIVWDVKSMFIPPSVANR